jgi:DNA-directed RNA polymerase beta' subunit
VRCRYDGTVRNSAGDVVQFLYGEDGMDAVRIEGQVRVREAVAGLWVWQRWQHLCQ